MLRQRVVFAVVLLSVVGLSARPAEAVQFNNVVLPDPAPQLRVTPVMSGLNNAWDIAVTDDGTLFVTERPGVIRVLETDGDTRQLTADLADLWVSGETGLEGIEADPDFASNRRLYTCQGTTDNTGGATDGTSVQVIAWTVNVGLTALTRVNDPLVGGIAGTSGRHGGCQPRVDPDGFLRIGTGDAATGTNPQNTSSLSGKTLRVNRFNGQGIAGNPFLGGGGDARIFSYGHRNVQGLATHPVTGQVWSVEHGPDINDEVNVLVAGGNYGWDPVPGYNESVPMTDFQKFPNARGAAWSSGAPTLATSGATFLKGSQWGPWQGALAVATLKGASLRIMRFNSSNQITSVTTPAELNGTFGRLRSAESGPCGVLYMTTDAADGNSQVLRVDAAVNARGPAAVKTAAGVTQLARCGPGGDVQLRTISGGGPGPWTSIGGLTRSEPDIASWGSGRTDAFAIGINGSMWTRVIQAGPMTPWVNIGGLFTSAPSAVATEVGRITVAGRGIDGQVWMNSLNNGAWGPWRSIGGRIQHGPEISARSAAIVDVFGVGTERALWHNPIVNGSVLGWRGLGGLLTSGPGSISWDGNRIDVFGRGTDRALWSKFWNGSVWSNWFSLGGDAASAPAATSDAFNRWDVYVEGIDDNFYRKSWTGTTFTNYILVPH